MAKFKKSGFKRQRKASKRMESYRMSRGGIRL